MLCFDKNSCIYAMLCFDKNSCKFTLVLKRQSLDLEVTSLNSVSVLEGHKYKSICK